MNYTELFNIMTLYGAANVNKLEQVGLKRVSFGYARSDQVIGFLAKEAQQIWKSKDISKLYKTQW